MHTNRDLGIQFHDNLEISFMDTNRDLGITSHVGHLRRTPEFVTGKWIEERSSNFMIIWRYISWIRIGTLELRPMWDIYGEHRNLSQENGSKKDLFSDRSIP